MPYIIDAIYKKKEQNHNAQLQFALRNIAIVTNYDTEPIYETLQPCLSRMSYFSQESSFQNFIPLSSAHEIISSTVIDNISSIDNITPLPKSILLDKASVVKDKEPKKRGRSGMTEQEKKESKRQRDEKKNKRKNNNYICIHTYIHLMIK